MPAKKPASLNRQGRETPQEIPLRVPAHGRGQLRVGGSNPGSGRPKDEFKARMRELASRDETQQALSEILADKSHAHYMKALAFAAEHGYGKATETLEVSGQNGGPIAMTVTFRK